MGATGMLAAAAAVFLIANPYVILDWRDWARGFVFQVNAYLPAHRLDQVGTAFAKQVAALWDTDTVILAAGVGGGLLLAGEAIARRRSDPARARAAWLLLPFPPLYTLLMSRFTEVYERNLIVTLPFLCLAAGYGAARLLTAALTYLPAIGAKIQQPTATIPRPKLKTQNLALAGSKLKTELLALALGLLLAAEPARRAINFDRYMAMPESRNLAAAWLGDALRAGHRAAVELHPWQVCAPAPHPCPEPDVLASAGPLTVRPPAWYAARGYDYVMLVGPEVAILADAGQSGPRPAQQLAPYLALPVVREFAGDRGGEKGPTVRVVQVAGAPGAIAGMTPSGARFGDLAALWGYARAPLAQASAVYDPAAGPPPVQIYHPGGAIGLNLYWRALPGSAGTPGHWTIALHLLDAAGATVAQIDVQPISNGRLRPLADWYPQEFLAGAYNIPLPPTLAPGAYHLTLALYDAPTGPSLTVQAPGGGTTPVLDLGPVVVAP